MTSNPALALRGRSDWLPEHLAVLRQDAATTIPHIASDAVLPRIAGLDLWDMWPVQNLDGSTAKFDGWTVWLILSAPILPDPDERHHIARIRLVTERAGEWRDCGHLLPDGLNPGTREWAGSALHLSETGEIVLFYTVAGVPGEVSPSFTQRLFQTRARLEVLDGTASASGWSVPTESVQADDVDYIVVNQSEGVPGFIKGFRDPFFFRDPADGAHYLLFTGSLRQSVSAWNGCIGLARANPGQLDNWQLLPPIIAADGLNNEQERPQMVYRDGLYYLFWSTQRKVFAPGVPSGPNGLYGMVSDRIDGAYLPLNGSGLVAGNPDDAPFQAYSWAVTGELEVAGFADLLGANGSDVVDDRDWRRKRFAGSPAPRFRIDLDGAATRVSKY